MPQQYDLFYTSGKHIVSFPSRRHAAMRARYLASEGREVWLRDGSDLIRLYLPEWADDGQWPYRLIGKCGHRWHPASQHRNPGCPRCRQKARREKIQQARADFPEYLKEQLLGPAYLAMCPLYVKELKRYRNALAEADAHPESLYSRLLACMRLTDTSYHPDLSGRVYHAIRNGELLCAMVRKGRYVCLDDLDAWIRRGAPDGRRQRK